MFFYFVDFFAKKCHFQWAQLCIILNSFYLIHSYCIFNKQCFSDSSESASPFFFLIHFVWQAYPNCPSYSNDVTVPSKQYDFVLLCPMVNLDCAFFRFKVYVKFFLVQERQLGTAITVLQRPCSQIFIKRTLR